MNGGDPSELARALGLTRAREYLTSTTLSAHWSRLVDAAIEQVGRHGQFEEWWNVARAFELPVSLSVQLDLDCPRVVSNVLPSESFEASLRSLGPWRKGPFEICGLHVDSEWRSDLKWKRLSQIASKLRDRTVLDVGTGNGYFLLRAVGAGARFVLGLDPGALSAAQYLAVQKCFRAERCAFLPLPAERFERECAAFDTVLSMGVLYHRRTPTEHLEQLRGFVKPGGEVVVETLVIEAASDQILVPEGRYARMRNVWHVPSLGVLQKWHAQAGLEVRRVGPIIPTTSDEQRASDWSSAVSLKDFLDPKDPTKTIEGHPAPRRVMVVSQRR